MVHAVHNSISPWIKERGALRDKCKKIKKTLPERVHGKHFMGGITVQKKGLAEK
jgi:hypothetical protein